MSKDTEQELIKYDDGTTSKYSFEKLRKFNRNMGLMHLIQATLMLIFGFTLQAFKDFSVEIKILKVEYPFNSIDDTLFTLSTVGPIVAGFLFFSALAHFLVAGPLYSWYQSNLKKKMNPIRWLEYAISSSLMIFLMAVLFGVKEFWILFLICVLNAMMNLFGHMMEVHNQYTEKTNWTSFIYGCIAGITPWIVITAVFASAMIGGGAPWFVPFIYAFELLLFMSFALNMYLQYKKIGPWKDYAYGERMYIILSLVAKTLLAWLVFAGVLQPGE